MSLEVIILYAAVFLIAGTFIGSIIIRRGTDRLLERRRRGLCLGCGYDLRHGTGKCPECGRPHAVGRTADPDYLRKNILRDKSKNRW